MIHFVVDAGCAICKGKRLAGEQGLLGGALAILHVVELVGLLDQALRFDLHKLVLKVEAAHFLHLIAGFDS